VECLGRNGDDKNETKPSTQAGMSQHGQG
jgi:hypothetical protein